MKEIVAIIRRQKLHETKTALVGLGFSPMSILSVSGRGKQKGFIGEVDPVMDEFMLDEADVDVRFIPKRLISIVADDADVPEIVETIIKTNNTGYPGDGKIFVLPITDAIRIRTSEIGLSAIK
ncbi:nitrogen regulatory protein P-II [Thermoanaerobacterium thermosaccharolyticum]|uniref:Nitrogen regulatory protein P-II n=1 Tax=Thermoanaerobacterium thermosaccharolyticum TaxID=1517 RepID=A0A223HVF4_THETR|nr:P-II family nitrogen regulator [Thermoanaerobacterium thermosaccharolyticum]AST56456.1 nitrogen regulatory protein P-II [Thermoanaerobacterium thermosaccharolyticum]